MAIPGGSIIHDVRGVVVDRIQSGGPGQLNIPKEIIKELGNFQTVATVTDTPELTFSLESLDVSTEIECLIAGKDPTAAVDGDNYNFTLAMPMDVISPFKSSKGVYTAVKGLVIPYLQISQATYRFGATENSTQSFQFSGDKILYTGGVPRLDVKTLVDNTLTYNFTSTPTVKYVESGADVYAYSVCVKKPSTGAYKRLFFGTDYTNTATGITLLKDWFDAGNGGYTELHISYATTATITYAQGVHQDTSVKPAAVRGKDVQVWIVDGSPESIGRIQTAEVNWNPGTVERDRELGNPNIVNVDYDTAEVTGSITIRPDDTTSLWTTLYRLTGVTTGETIGPFSSTPVPIEIRINDPETGDRLKTLYVPDARFELPALSERAGTRLDVQLPFQSDGGTLTVYKGARP